MIIMVATLKKENQTQLAEHLDAHQVDGANDQSTTLSTQIQCGTYGEPDPMYAERGHVGNGDDQDLKTTVGPGRM